MNEVLEMRSSIKNAIMSLLNWLNPPVKHSHIENSDSKEEDKPEGEDDVTSDMTPALMSDGSAHGTSTTSKSGPKCSKQSKC